ncbi:ABC-type multidrug transport system ATPase subunit [Streptomyces puniciscabiei]|uniref:ABC-type multidrug transport system ATPase subunit n=1 Tax=Streptomyces puniciscabiei TaxID=164348 RepID=A0A542UFX5_9ACTN|nr:ATP-binding cassette domain-containing protein [Streptomyces puniciscabiei]TQK97972.1 ABC-type multidrug transport system ATPase subunit [Streptomyces puniciscabiei]
MGPIASLSGIAQGYGRHQVITGLHWDLDVGVHGLLGPNGAGKTTLLRTLATVAPPQEGTLEICGTKVHSERSARSARPLIGYLPQEFGYFPSFSVYDFVRYSAWLRGIPDGEAHDAARKAIASVLLEERSQARMKSLSGGMLRRAGIAAAIVGSPRLLLLDEPTVGLDPEQRLQFRELIRSLTGSAIVLSTHLVEDVAAVCDQVVVMQSGRFLFRGTPEALAGHSRSGVAGDSPLERGYMAALSGQGELS